MAKELPYFKFEPNQWENGIIQMCSRESKGLFIDIISIYWQRLGDLPYRYVLQKLCNGNANALKELSDENIIKVEDGNIYIDFLDDQLKEFKDKSKTASQSANARWDKQRKNKENNANAMQTHNECNAIREDKIILDNSNSCLNHHNNFKLESLKPSLWKDTVCMNNKIDPNKLKYAFDEYNKHLIEQNVTHKNLKDYQSHFVYWQRIVKNK